MKKATVLFFCIISVIATSAHASHNYEERSILFEKLIQRVSFSPVQEEMRQDGEDSSFVGMAGDGKIVGCLRRYNKGLLIKQFFFGESSHSCQWMEFFPDGFCSTISTGTWRTLEREGRLNLYCTAPKGADYFDPLGQPIDKSPGTAPILGQAYYSSTYRLLLFQWVKPDGKYTIWYYISVKEQSEDDQYIVFGKTAVDGIYDREQKKLTIDKVTHYLGKSQFQVFTDDFSSGLPITISFIDWYGVTHSCDCKLIIDMLGYKDCAKKMQASPGWTGCLRRWCNSTTLRPAG